MWTLVAIALVLVAAACGVEERPATSDPSGQTTPTAAHAEPSSADRPPPVQVDAGGSTTSLDPWSYCWTYDAARTEGPDVREGVCTDGIPPDPPPDVGSFDHLVVSFPLPGWTFQAGFAPDDRPCALPHIVDLAPTAHGHRLEPAGAAAPYTVTLMGRGEGGSVTVSFRWTTPRAGPEPAPEARLGFVDATPDGRGVDGIGGQLELDHLAASPETVTATLTVTAADDTTLTVDLDPVPVAPPGCDRYDGVAHLRYSVAGVSGVPTIGPPPYRHHVELVLDGVRHVADARWPDDEIEEVAPAVRLDFQPPLPAR